MLNRDIDDRSITNILSNDKEGSQEAVEYLIKNGHQDIAIIEGIEGFKSSQQRKEGYLAALIRHHIPIKHEYSVKGQYDMESGFQAMERLLALPNTPTAVFCSNDDMAIGAMNAIFAKGMRVPDDISVIGFDDIGFSQYITPRLSTVKRPVEKISVLGAKKLLKLISTPDTKAEKIFENTEFMVRDSVKDITT